MNARAWQFFMEHAGFGTPPGRAVCAASLARAEEQAESAGLRFEWVEDECPDLSWMDAREVARDHEVLGCIARSPEGEHLASLWGIVDADANYRRVVEAELAAEALDGYAAPIAGCP
jgi:hypothetical protein